jgi:hypothetical protein
LPGDFETKHVSFHQHVIGHCKTHNWILSQTENARGKAAYFDMPSNFTVNDYEENHSTGNTGR